MRPGSTGAGRTDCVRPNVVMRAARPTARSNGRRNPSGVCQKCSMPGFRVRASIVSLDFDVDAGGRPGNIAEELVVEFPGLRRQRNAQFPLQQFVELTETCLDPGRVPCLRIGAHCQSKPLFVVWIDPLHPFDQWEGRCASSALETVFDRLLQPRPLFGRLGPRSQRSQSSIRA